ncbi:MAG: nlhH 2, partial [Steroidobacteraceae bacterium]|nr:nlhH 2 [Steroidobacteraceae bacterium]
DENIMRGLARELTRGGKFVVASIDYRWAGKADGDATSTTMANIIEDMYGAIAHIAEHARSYGGDATRILLTGDSAGGHLSAAGSLMVNMIGDGGFGRTAGVFEFKPSYLPKGRTSADVKKDLLVAIKGAAPTYGVFGGPFLNHYSEDPKADDSWKAALAPILHIPKASERAVPQYLVRGTNDPLIPDEMCKTFMDALVKAGQRVQYVQVGGAGHAFFDWKPDATTKATFKQYGVYYAAEMKAFFESVVKCLARIGRGDAIRDGVGRLRSLVGAEPIVKAQHFLAAFVGADVLVDVVVEVPVGVVITVRGLVRRNLRIQRLARNGRGRDGLVRALVWHTTLLLYAHKIGAGRGGGRQRVPRISVGAGSSQAVASR